MFLDCIIFYSQGTRGKTTTREESSVRPWTIIMLATLEK